MPLVRATLQDPTGQPLANGTLKASRKYPRLSPVGTSFVPLEVTRTIAADGSVSLSLHEGLHSFAVYPQGSSVPSLFFEAYVPDISGDLQLLELYRPYGYEEPEQVAKPWDESVTSLVDAYRSAPVGTVPQKTTTGYTFVVPSGGGGGGAIAWGNISGLLTNQADLVAALAGYATTSALTAGLAGKADVTHDHPLATLTLPGFLSAADKGKLDSVASGATANSPDATLLNRANHTGTQTIATVTGLQAAINGKQNASSELTALSGLSTTGIVRRTGANTYVTNGVQLADLPDLGTFYQPRSPTLDSIVNGLSGAASGAVPTRQADGRLAYVVPSGGGGSSVVGVVFIGQIADPWNLRQELTANTWTTIRLNALLDPLNRWDPVTNTYNIQTSGTYLCMGRIRLEDGLLSSTYGHGIHSANDDAAWILWTPTAQNNGARRNSSLNSRIAAFDAGALVRLYANLNTINSPIIFAEMYIVRIS